MKQGQMVLILMKQGQQVEQEVTMTQYFQSQNGQ